MTSTEINYLLASSMLFSNNELDHSTDLDLDLHYLLASLCIIHALVAAVEKLSIE